MAVTLRRRRFTLDEYHRMGEAGILHEDDRVELIEGEIVEMAPIGSRHAATVARVTAFFTRRLGDRATIWSQNPVVLPAQVSEPQPDIMLLAPRADFYASALPEPHDVLLLIEVADSSLTYDRRTKLPLYARAGVSEAWLIDVDAGRVEIHRSPSGGRYRDVRSPARDESFAPLAFPDVAVTSSDLLG
ncbi:MAG: Uma2 family endonuclease [Candidatus Rokubacteria bacterium]|nr:Uma2 family endonuclease [Candidatus Rokubacteria bacterium]